MKFNLKFSFDWGLVLIPLLLVSGSIATLFSITSISGRSDLVIDQITYLAIAIVLYFIFAAIDYRSYKSLSWYLYVLGVVLLIIVELFGQTIFGSTRWINLGFTQFQPSELVKLIYIVFAASYFADEQKIKTKKVIIFILLSLVPILLILKEPDLGTTLVIVACLIATLLAIRLRAKFYLILIGIALILSPFVWFNLKPYQQTRITTFMSPESDPLGSGYNVSQSKIAVGSGGLFGKGFSGATQSQLQFLPVAHVDFIFSGWAEATGFIGSMFLVSAFCLLIFRVLVIANLARDKFGFYISIGAGALLSFQVLVNIGMNIGLMPVTGIPLPFFSYGGTSMLIMTMMIAIIQSIYLRRKGLKFD